MSLKAAASGRFSMDREEVRKAKDKELVSHFAGWLTRMSGVKIRRKTFLKDIGDGTALCTVMAKIEDSGLTKYHNVPASPKHLKAFHGKENLAKFQDACRRLAMPDAVTASDLEAGNLSKALSVLIQMEEIADEEGLEPIMDGADEEDDDDDDEEEEEEVPEPEPEAAVVAPLVQKPKERRPSKEKRNSRRRSSRRQQEELSPFMQMIEQVKIMCGCGKDTVVK